MSTPRRLSPEARRARITDAAVRLLKEHNFSNLTVDMLRAEAGLSKGGLYHHVKSKNDVLLMVCDAAGEAMLESVRAAEAFDGPGRERLQLLLGSHLDLVLEYGDAMWAFFAERRHLSDTERDRVIAWEREVMRGAKRVLDRLVKDGEVRPLNTYVLSHTFLGMLNWVTRWYRGNPPASQLKQTLADSFFNGILVPPESETKRRSTKATHRTAR